jgi:type IV pilus assembly protein PilA
MRDAKGFTLIELMIVVAIIGILAAVAVPNYLKFSAKARQSEARYNLAGIYSAESSYFGENNTFSSDFSLIRWRPDGSIYYYTFGLGGATDGIPLAANPAPAGMVPAPIVGASGFTACAWGNIDSDPAKDQWYINDVKSLNNPVNDWQ